MISGRASGSAGGIIPPKVMNAVATRKAAVSMDIGAAGGGGVDVREGQASVSNSATTIGTVNSSQSFICSMQHHSLVSHHDHREYRLID